MRILIATPLYPPDMAEPAPYVKEFARRLFDTHTVSVLAYNHIPERINGVEIAVVKKKLPLPIRLVKFLITLIRRARNADIVFVQNGASTELPASIAALLVRTPVILRLGDEAALRFAKAHTLLRIVQSVAIRRADAIIVHSDDAYALVRSLRNDRDILRTPRPSERPEIMPFQPHPTKAFEKYERAWKQHISEITAYFTKHATR